MHTGCQKSGRKCSKAGESCSSSAKPPDFDPRVCPLSKLDVTEELRQFWKEMPITERRRILRVEKKDFFKQIRCLYCSRCYGLFQLRYEELQGNPPSDCPTCKECYSSLVVADDGALQLQEDVILSDPFQKFQDARYRERERELQFMTGNICGSGWVKRPGQNMCSLHTTPVPCEALAEYWSNLPEDHRSALFCLPEEDFVADLDAHLKYQLKICRDCRSNVMRAFKDQKNSKHDDEPFLLCDDHTLTIQGGAVQVEGPGGSKLFEKAEEIEENKISEGNLDVDLSPSDDVRHAETPALALEALQECALLIFKSQTEVAFREQSAGHNALLLFVYLTLQIMEQNLSNAFKELSAKQAEVELFELLAVEGVPSKKSGKKSRAKKKRNVKDIDMQLPLASVNASGAEVEHQFDGLELELQPKEELQEIYNLPIYPEIDEDNFLSKLCEAKDLKDEGEERDASVMSHTRKLSDSIYPRAEVKGTKQCVKLEEWPTVQESNSTLHSIKMPSLPRNTDNTHLDEVILSDGQGDSTPPGDFRIHALSSQKERTSTALSQDSEKKLTIANKSEGSHIKPTPYGVDRPVDIPTGDEHFSLFHNFPGDYTLVNSPERAAHNGAFQMEMDIKPTEFDHCYTLFGKAQWNPLVSVLGLSLMPFSRLDN